MDWLLLVFYFLCYFHAMQRLETPWGLPAGQCWSGDGRFVET